MLLCIVDVGREAGSLVPSLVGLVIFALYGGNFQLQTDLRLSLLVVLACPNDGPRRRRQLSLSGLVNHLFLRVLCRCVGYVFLCWDRFLLLSDDLDVTFSPLVLYWLSIFLF